MALQQQLIRLTLDALAQIDARLPPTLTRVAVQEKWRRGVPALRSENLTIPGSLKEVLPSIATILAEGGAGDSAQHIRDALLHGDIDAGSLLRVSAARDLKALRTSALHMGFSPDLLWLIGELGSAPLAHDLQQQIMQLVDPADWDRGYCPCCGSWPVLIEASAGSRTLRCSYCALGWMRQTRGCLYCGNGGADFVVAAPDPARAERRVELCARCGSYTKVMQSASAIPFPLLAIEDLATLDLDRAAMERQYRRPDLPDLGAIAPPTATC